MLADKSIEQLNSQSHMFNLSNYCKKFDKVIKEKSKKELTKSFLNINTPVMNQHQNVNCDINNKQKSIKQLSS